MTIPKKYLQDRVVVLLLSLNVLLSFISALSTLFLLGKGNNEVFIAQYRSNLGLSSYKPGDVSTFISFMVFVILVLGFHTFLSMRVYRLHRQFALAILALGTLLIILAGIVSNALLGLR